MAYNVEKKIIPGLFKRNLQSSSLIIAHDSGNPNNVGSDSLDNEVSFMTRNHQSAFTSHWVGSGGRVVQLAPVGMEQWGAGGIANKHSYAQVELARTNDRATFEKDYAVYIELLRDLAEEANIPKTLNTGSKKTDKGVKTHHWVSLNLGNTDHTDPDGYLASWGISIAQFRKDIENGVGKVVANTSKVNADNSIHTVVAGDNLWDISQKYGTSVQSIKALNGMKSDLIHPGDKLKVQDEEAEKATPKASNVFKVGQRVTVSNSAKKYATGENVPSSIKGNTYTVQQVGTGKVLLKEIVSWVRTGDIVGGTNVSTPKASSGKISIGSKVTLSNSASNYATGEKIPNNIKGKTYTVQQVKSDRVLLKEILSWVKIGDVGGGSSSAGSTNLSVGNKVTLKNSASKYATGEKIPSSIKGKKYTIQQVQSDRVLLKEIVSWVYKSDVTK